MSWYLVLACFVNVPITLNATGLGVALGAVVGTQVVVAGGRSVIVGVGRFGVGVGDPDGVGVNVGETGAPVEIIMA
jgi:hypothetical protein